MIWRLSSRFLFQPPGLRASANDRGFTLIEIISVLVLLGILAAVVANQSQNTSVDVLGEMEVIKGHLRYAQMKAMNSGTTWGIIFAGNSYTLQQNGAASASPLPGENSSTYTLPKGTASATPNPITFNQWGDPSAAITVTVTVGTSSQVFTVANTTGFIP